MHGKILNMKLKSKLRCVNIADNHVKSYFT